MHNAVAIFNRTGVHASLASKRRVHRLVYIQMEAVSERLEPVIWRSGVRVRVMVGVGLELGLGLGPFSLPFPYGPGSPIKPCQSVLPSFVSSCCILQGS